jgi:hypothetical protein
VKKIAIVALVLAAQTAGALAGSVKYDPKSPAAAVAVNEQVRKEIAGKVDAPLCLYIWNDGSCRVAMTAAGQMDGGGGAGGAAGASGE